MIKLLAENKIRNNHYPVKGKNILVYGLGRSGVANAKLLIGRGAKVTGIDDVGDLPKERRILIDDLVKAGMVLALEPSFDAKRQLFREADIVVVSPGVVLPNELREMCVERGAEIIGEFEIAARMCPAPIVAISGSNGKTTTSCLTYEFIKAGGGCAHLVGNVGSSYDIAQASGYMIGDERILFTGEIGVPFSDRLEAIQPGDIVVAEVSSYQLGDAPLFRPSVAVLLNITEDHLARHGDMTGYVAAKGRMFANQTSGDYAILNADDPLVAEAFNLGSKAAKRLYFSFRDTSADAYYRDESVFIKVRGEAALLIRRGEFALPGNHNIENLMAAALAATAVGCGLSDVRNAARAFKGVEHRIEFVGEFRGIKVYNDSKGTNPDSTIKALNSFDSPVILVIGGYEKGSDFTPLYEIFPRKVKHALVVGATAERLNGELAVRGFDNRTVVGDLNGVMAWVLKYAKRGDILLLSPASASFDQFSSYEERGRVFKRMITEMLTE